MTPPELNRALSELCGVRTTDEPIVSLYLDTRWQDEQQRERVRLFVRERIKEALDHYDGDEKVERNLARVLGFVLGVCEQVQDEDQTGIALFACESLGLWRPLTFRHPFQNYFALDAVPHLLRLARLADDVQPALVAVSNGYGVHIYEVGLGGVVNEAVIEGPVPRRHRSSGFHGYGTSAEVQGGMVGGMFYEREKKNERRQEELVERYRRQAATELVHLFDATPGSHVVLVGGAQGAASFERHLPERVRKAIVDRLPYPGERGSGAAREEMVARAVRAVDEQEKRQQTRVVDWTVGQALRGGFGVLGPEDVVLAVNEKRVHRLVIEEDFQREGWRCQLCHTLGVSEADHETCPYCGGVLDRVESMGEELVTQVLADDGEVEVVAHTNKLHSYRGIGALLRQANGSGMKGAAPPATI